MKLLITIVFTAVCAHLSAAPICSFECLTSSESNLSVCSPIATQFSLEILDTGPGTVGFQFANAGPAAVSVTNLYFSDPLDLTTGLGAAPASSIGVLFSPGGPDILASVASAAGFVQEYKSQAIGGLTLSPGEMVTVQMTLTPGNSAETVRLALIDSNVRVIIATVGIGGPDRTVYMEATCCADVPEPPPLGLAGLGLTGLAAVALRRRAHASKSLT